LTTRCAIYAVNSAEIAEMDPKKKGFNENQQEEGKFSTQGGKSSVPQRNLWGLTQDVTKKNVGRLEVGKENQLRNDGCH